MPATAPARRHRLLTVALTVVCVWLAAAGVRATVRHLYAQRELAAVRADIDQAQHGNERLERSLGRMQEPAWLALLARDRLNYKRPDETVVFVYKSEKSGIIAPPQAPTDDRPNWRRWWDWLLRNGEKRD